MKSNNLYAALKSLVLVISDDPNDYPDASSYRQVQDRVERAKQAIQDVEKEITND
jgi:hypothetical protein